MLRYRELYQKGTEVILKVIFTPSADSEFHLDSSAVELRWNPKRLAMLRIERVELPQDDLPFPGTPIFYLLPELEQIQEEVNYLFNLILSLKPYEITTQTSRQENISQI